MEVGKAEESESKSRLSARNGLLVSGIVSFLLYGVIAGLSRDFSYGSAGADRPLLEVLGLFDVAFAIYLWQIRLVSRNSMHGSTMPMIVLLGVAFRILLLFSEPIQEVDAYRYLWDGQVVAAASNPWRYAPQEVLDVSPNELADEGLLELVGVRDGSRVMSQILERVHYGELTTVYPPVSQAVFALAAVLTPDSFSVRGHLIVMKTLIVAFDLATWWMLCMLLRHVGMRVEWSIIYAWCPLVLKEFANSGHLDSIAVFLTVCAAYGMVRAIFPHSPPDEDLADDNLTEKMSSRRWSIFAAAMTTLAIGAKLYPLILGPVLFLSVGRRIGWRHAVVTSICCLLCSCLIIFPMVAQYENGVTDKGQGRIVADTLPLPFEPQMPGESFNNDAVPVPSETRTTNDANEAGLKAFARRWQMNDFLFLILFENLRARAEPQSVASSGTDQGGRSNSDSTVFEPALPGEQLRQATSPIKDAKPRLSHIPWFIVTPNEWRRSLASQVEAAMGLPAERVPFLLTRSITTAAFLIIACWLAWRAAGASEPVEWLRAVFLTIAWFWLLLPTQNPWYWIWALPFLPFATSRAWLAVSGLTMMYYFRFWLRYHAMDTSILGTGYAGPEFFDYVVSWFEFGPLLVWLLFEWIRGQASVDRS